MTARAMWRAMRNLLKADEAQRRAGLAGTGGRLARLIGPDRTRDSLEPAQELDEDSPQPTGEPTYLIHYADAFGDITERRIYVLAVREEPSGVVYLDAYCTLRMAIRSFRVERIRRAVHLATGKDVKSPATCFTARPQKGPALERTALPDHSAVDHEWVMARARPGLHALLWLAAADRDLMPAEVVVMLSWVASRARIHKGHQPFHERAWSPELALAWLREQVPSMADAHRGLSRMGQAEAARFLGVMEDMMLADGGKSPMEEERARHLRALLPAR